jgi:predicted DNA-binding transcriptional regulator YafY
MTPRDPLVADDDLDDDPPPDRRLTGSEQKLQRWVDLLASLLTRHRPATFDELARDVPGYDIAHGDYESVKRTFERDKDELRRFGVPIDTIRDGEDEPVGYHLARKSFYLPYLNVSGRERAANTRPASTEGYRSLETLAFEPDELDAIVDAAARVRALGDPVLATEAEAAISKLALDLPLGAVLDAASPEQAAVPLSRSQREFLVQPRRQADPLVFERLSDALARHKLVTFDYYTIERAEQSHRTVEPYGLFFVSAHWYLAARDIDRNALRNFRLSRISNVKVNKTKSQSADYDVPSKFSLADHARSREPWEIGEGDATTALVDFVAMTGTTRAALELGRAVSDSSTRREFDVRRIDAFARWLLSFGGDAVPLAPPELCAEYDRLASATLALYSTHNA